MEAGGWKVEEEKVEGEKVRASTMRRHTAPSRGSTLAAIGRDIFVQAAAKSIH